MAVAARDTRLMAQIAPIPPIPPEVTGAGLVLTVLGAVKIVMDMFKSRAEHRKVSAEAETAEVLGDQAYEELRELRMEHLARFLKELQLRQDHLAAELEEERAHNLAFRAAVLQFIGVVSSVLPELPEVVRLKLQAALDQLRTHDAWNR